jgi:diguanylate cyclase (GGDEF)-like protein/PAS domain S-box-containing protein
MAVPTRHLTEASSPAADPEAHGPYDGLDDGLLRALVRAVDAMVCVIDGNGRILLANPALLAFSGQTAADLLGRAFWDVLIAPEHVLLAQDAVAQAMATGRAHPQEGDWLTASGERRLVAVSNTVLVEDGRPYAIGCVARDVTDDRRREEQLHRRAQTDQLTGIANRAALFDALAHCLDGAEGAGCAVLFCDLDEFKWVNDEHGHAMGDRMLTEVAARLVEVTGPDGLVARFGGDEFVVLCPRLGEDDLTALAARIVARVDEPFPGPEGPLTVGMSVGVAVARPGETADDLIGRADRAMYGVKTHQRRRTTRPAPASGGQGAGDR